MTARSLPTFEKALTSGPIVFDGATGTLLYERGVYLNKCFELLCLTDPELVADVHRDYVALGADVIETNTYGANRMSLDRHGHGGKVTEICAAAVRIARDAAQGQCYVAGAIGPTGLLPKDLIREKTRTAAGQAFAEQAAALCEAGVDLLVYETFPYLGELEIAVESAGENHAPIVAQASFDTQGFTQDGADPEEAVARLKCLNVTMVGANCVLAPENLIGIAERMVGRGLPVIMQPNAGQPEQVDGRTIYHRSPETFGVVARRAFKLGVSAIGGCCGTGPEHIRRVIASARMLGGGRWRGVKSSAAPRALSGRPAIPMAERSALGAKLSRGEWVVSVEVLPPTGLDPTSTLDGVKSLIGEHVDVINIPDGPRATARMSNQVLAAKIQATSGIETLVHVCGRDRNLLALQGDLLAAHVQGLNNLVVITGDPPKIGDYPDATAVFDVDSIGILQMASRLNRGLDPAGKPMLGQTRFVLATGAEPASRDLDKEVRRLFEKRDAGAEVVMTQPVYDPLGLDRILDALSGLDLPVLIGILPLASLRNAEFLNKNVPGMRIPETVMARLRAAGADGVAQEGIRIAGEALAAVKPRVQGVYLMPPFGRLQAALAVMRCAEQILGTAGRHG